MITSPFHLYFHSSNQFHLTGLIPVTVKEELEKLVYSQIMALHSSVGRLRALSVARTWMPFWGKKSLFAKSKLCFFSAELSLVTRIMFERLKFKVFKHFLASSQRYKLEISLKTRENTQNWIIYEPYVNEQRTARGHIAQARAQIQEKLVYSQIMALHSSVGRLRALSVARTWMPFCGKKIAICQVEIVFFFGWAFSCHSNNVWKA